jgi:hypothetical protein
MERMIREALAPVLADVRATGAPEPRVVEADWDPDLQSTVHLFRPDGTGAGVGVLRTASRANRAVQAADGTQQWVIESLWFAGRPTNWPVCPAHPHTHPMRAVLLRGTPTWQCPEQPAVVVPIGALPGQPADTR